MRTQTTLVLALAPLCLAATGARSEARPSWETAAAATAQYNPGASDEGAATLGAGISARLLRAVGFTGSVGLQFDAIWLIPGNHTIEFDARQLDLLLVGRTRLVSRPSWSLSVEAAAGVAQYTGMVDIPETPGCFGCGRYGDTTYRPNLQAALGAALRLTPALFVTTGIRASLVVLRAEATDTHNFLPPSLALRFELGLGAHF
jgi:hypothetical protein